jgi:hypothetical protein
MTSSHSPKFLEQSTPMREAGENHIEKQGNRILEKFCIAIENISGCWLVMTSNALNQAQNHGARKVLVNGSFEYLHPFYFPLFQGSLC